MFCYRVGRIGGYAHNDEAEFLGGFEINIIKASTAESDQFNAVFGKLSEAGMIQVIIYKDTYRNHPGSAGDGLYGKTKLMKMPIDILMVYRVLEVFLVIRFRILKCCSDHLNSFSYERDN